MEPHIKTHIQNPRIHDRTVCAKIHRTGKRTVIKDPNWIRVKTMPFFNIGSQKQPTQGCGAKFRSICHRISTLLKRPMTTKTQQHFSQKVKLHMNQRGTAMDRVDNRISA